MFNLLSSNYFLISFQQGVKIHSKVKKYSVDQFNPEILFDPEID